MEEFKQKSITPHAVTYTADHCACPEVKALVFCCTSTVQHPDWSTMGAEQFDHRLGFHGELVQPHLCSRDSKENTGVCHSYSPLNYLLQFGLTIPQSLCYQLCFLRLWNKPYSHKPGLKLALGWENKSMPNPSRNCVKKNVKFLQNCSCIRVDIHHSVGVMWLTVITVWQYHEVTGDTFCVYS